MKYIARLVFAFPALLGILAFALPAHASAASIDVWWPTDKAEVAGTQPFKALVKDMPVDGYRMFWQVDGGQLNQMESNPTDYPHKEASVDLSGWKWRDNGEYKIRFVAKDSGGSTIADREVTIVTNKNESSHTEEPGKNEPSNDEPEKPSDPVVTPPSDSSGSSDPSEPSTPVSPIPKRVKASIWWPTKKTELAAVQPFKARLENVDLGAYDMFWQVDGGRLNKMADSSIDGPHKESLVDVSSWKWNGRGPYRISFIAKDSAGTDLIKKSVTVYVGGSAGSSDSSAPEIPTTPPSNPPSSDTDVPSQPQPVAGNPLSGLSFYVDANNPAKRQADEWRSSRPADAALMDKIASQPGARWFGDWNGNIRDDVKSYVDAAASQNQVPVMIAYNIPQRDCGSYSAGGVGSPEAYKAWIRAFAEGIGNRTAVVVLEPDSLTLIDCLSSADRATRFALIKDATSVLKANGKTVVYLDAGHSNWVNATDIAARLNDAGIAAADGFSLNVSNFEPTQNLLAFGTTVSGLTGGKHFVLDTSRNGLGANGQWCNPDGRALGAKVTTSTGNALADAFLWLKVPGESDGTCNGGPSAGTWWPDYALGLAKRAAY